ncbi:tetratricopeptide repeat protein [Streptomyces sp. NPDC001793]|uniref:tetratricopeptide repeat protein n=1 Tax=Streptomyces sp. NPDC001793 TaxID=3154657 RepID=UPI00331E3337
MTNTLRDSVVHGPVIMAGTVGDVQVTVQQSPHAVLPGQVALGAIPLLASAFQPRTAIRAAFEAAARDRAAGVRTVLLSGAGGVGKSQLAAWYAHQAVADGTGLVLWAGAADPAGVTTAYARAAAVVQAPGATGESAEQDAACFLSWLAGTERSWLIVLDDVTDFAADGLWPTAARPGHGLVLATTRRRDAVATAAGRALVDVGRYTPEESAAYLSRRLAQAGRERLLDGRAAELAAALGHLPLALGHAASYLINTDRTTGDYVELFARRSVELDAVLPSSADSENYGRPVTTALLLALDAAQSQEPQGLALPALRLAAVFAPSGHPRELWTTQAVTGYLARHRTPPEAPAESDRPRPDSRWWRRLLRRNRAAGAAADGAAALRVLAMLHNYNLLTDLGPDGGAHAITLHPLTARAARDVTADAGSAHRAAVEAVGELWPEDDRTHRELAAALRACVDNVVALADDRFWRTVGVGIRHRAGESLVSAGLHEAAMTYWQRLQNDAARILGPRHIDAINCAAGLAVAYQAAGRNREAVKLHERLLTRAERTLGPRQPLTVAIRGNLAACYSRSGRVHDALLIQRQLMDRTSRVDGGNDGFDSIAARQNLAGSYLQEGRLDAALTLLEESTADAERALGGDHPDTLAARHNLALAYRTAGRVSEAIDVAEQVVLAREQVIGGDHPHTIESRFCLGGLYVQNGRIDEAVTLLEETVADAERALGGDHPDTLAARHNLALAYREVQGGEEAQALLRRSLEDSERVLGTDDPMTIRRRRALADTCHRVGDLDLAIELEEQTVSDARRVLGDSAPETVFALESLAAYYLEAGRGEDSIAAFEQTLSAATKALGPHDPTTMAARGNLAFLLVARARRYLETGQATAALQDTRTVICSLSHYLNVAEPQYGPILRDARRVAETAGGRSRTGDG